jgi:hypothetical protein
MNFGALGLPTRREANFHAPRGVARPWVTKMREVQVSVTDFGAKGLGNWDDTPAFQHANDAVAKAGYGKVHIPPPKVAYMLRTVRPSSFVSWHGSTMGESICKQWGAGHDDGIFAYRGTSTKDEIELTDLTLDCNSINSGIVAEWVTNFRVRRVRTKNVPFWGIFVGVFDALDAQTRNKHILVEDCSCDSEQVTFEGVLLFNTEKVTVRRVKFAGNASAPGLGIYQLVDHAVIDDCDFQGLATGAYYSVSTNNIHFDKCRFSDCSQGLQGANESDNGMFGFTRTRGLWVRNCEFLACTNIGFDLGAVDGGCLSDSIFRANVNNSLVIDAGNDTGPGNVHAPVTHFEVHNTKFVSNNTSNTLHLAHPAILLREVEHSHITFANVECYDDQVTPTQRHPVVFDSPGPGLSHNNITFIGGRLQAYNGVASITKVNNASLSGVRLIGTRDVALLPGDAIPLFGVEPAATLGGVWGADTSPPSIGNGTIAFKGKRDGDFIQMSVELTAGSTTTFGSGAFFFQLPAPFDANAVMTTFGSVYALDNGTASFVGTCTIAAGTNKVYFWLQNSGGVLAGSNSPFTWANGDQIKLSIRYPVF